MRRVPLNPKSGVEFGESDFPRFSRRESVGIVSGHAFSRAERMPSRGFSPCHGKPSAQFPIALTKEQGLKPSESSLFAARLKPCPDTRTPASDFRVSV